MKRAGLALVVLFLLILGAALVLLPFVAAASFHASKTTQTGGGGVAEICAAGEAGQAQIPEEYRDDVAKAAQVSGVSQELIASQIFQESTWDPSVTSPSGARGLAQFKDDTWPDFGEGGDPYNGHDAIAAQARFLKWLKDRFTDLANGDEEELVKMVLSGYRLGFNVVEDAGGVLLVVAHDGIDRAAALERGFDPDDYVAPDDIVAALPHGWQVERYTAERHVTEGRGAYHHADVVVIARRSAESGGVDAQE